MPANPQMVVAVQNARARRSILKQLGVEYENFFDNVREMQDRVDSYLLTKIEVSIFAACLCIGVGIFLISSKAPLVFLIGFVAMFGILFANYMQMLKPSKNDYNAYKQAEELKKDSKWITIMQKFNEQGVGGRF